MNISPYFTGKSLFNEPWMDGLNQDLLYRYWKKKDADTILITKSFANNVVAHVDTPFGELRLFGGLQEPDITLTRTL